MAIVMRMPPARGSVPEHEQKQAAISYLHEAWAEARLDGIDPDCMAQACLFAALTELVTTYGEDATARFAEGLSKRIANGEFSVDSRRQ
jgi:hypothetical protein